MKDNRVGIKAARITVIGTIIASVISGIFLLINQKQNSTPIIVVSNNTTQNTYIKRIKDASGKIGLLVKKIENWDYYSDQELTKPELVNYIKESVRPAVATLKKEHENFPREGSAKKFVEEIEIIDAIIEEMIVYCSDDSLQKILNNPERKLEELKSEIKLFVSASEIIIETAEKKISEFIN